ncbi:uncharacterized protein N7459_008522 [Penicillium hispanicum]|uniref:uncharacterized protein n=1 Tax=Penicillium hispanicum TaxID=1080232 RepID=UPI002540F416|nr:uncharacterized protein N7459_008522 [Penicillium hispanicum]KAJ5574095.1 hypothetical protein N7459_008522 [Penicillium hispanicum]
MGIPGLINAIGTGERISLSKLAVSHLERTARPIRVAVDISIWLFQVQAGRGGKNPELRTLFYRLLKLLALPIHPLFVYDGSQKPPFKRGKAVSARSYGNAPIIRRSKDLIERFRFPWHEAPGEAEAECARLQQAGIVDAVMSNDVDALMFGSTLTILNFSKENGSGTSAATHVTCYRMGSAVQASNVPLNRAGMILFALLSGADYLPSGVPKCGSKLAAEIAKAGFGEDLLQELSSQSPDLDSRLNEWRERLQYELEENESGYFATKHKAVRIPEDFPDPTILKFYAEPAVSTADEMAGLRRRLKHEWDREIDPLAIRSFAAENFEWNYRSGARKVIKLLAEPLISYRLRLQRPVSGVLQGSLAPDCDTPWMQKVYRSRASFGTDGMNEVQMDILPIDVVGLDLLAEEPNPPLPSQESVPSQSTHHSGDEEEDPELATEVAPPTPSKSRVTKRFDPFAIGKIWIFETVARLGVPDAVRKWEDEQAEKANKSAPKRTTNRRTGPKKKGPIDPGMKRGSILKYGTLTKDKSELSSNKTHLLEAATVADKASHFRTPSAFSEYIDPQDPFSPSMYSQQSASSQTCPSSYDVDELIDNFSSLSTASPIPRAKRTPVANQSLTRARAGVLTTAEADTDGLDSLHEDHMFPLMRTAMKYRYSVSAHEALLAETFAKSLVFPSHSPTRHHCRNSRTSTAKKNVVERPNEVEELEKVIGSLSISSQDNSSYKSPSPAHSLRRRETSQNPEFEHLPRPRKIQDHRLPSLSANNGELKGLSTTQPVSTSDINQQFGEASYFNRETGKDTKRQIIKPKISTREKSNDSETRQTIGHLENIITTSDGFWNVDKSAEPGLASTDFSPSQHAGENSSRQGKSKQGKKKRIARVSILDLA